MALRSTDYTVDFALLHGLELHQPSRGHRYLKVHVVRPGWKTYGVLEAGTRAGEYAASRSGSVGARVLERFEPVAAEGLALFAEFEQAVFELDPKGPGPGGWGGGADAAYASISRTERNFMVTFGPRSRPIWVRRYPSASRASEDTPPALAARLLALGAPLDAFLAARFPVGGPLLP